MATAKVDAHNIRIRDALFLPFKRRIASLSIRTENWKSADSAGRAEAQGLARSAIAEVDEQVAGLSDLKFPAELKPKPLADEIDRMKASYAELRKSLVAIAG